MKNQHWLMTRLAQFDSTPAFVWHDEIITYDQLLLLIQNWLTILNEHPILKGDVVAICGACTPNMCALLIALFIHENLVLPIASVTQTMKEKYIQIAEAKFSIEFMEDGHYLVFLHSNTASHPMFQQLQSQSKPGLILFSSGSTGESKAIVLDVARLLEKNKELRKGVNTLFFLLLDHIGGNNTLLHVLTQGGTLIIPKDHAVETICKAVSDYKIELLPTTPTFLTQLVMSGLQKEYDLSSLKLITYGTEPMPAATLAGLNELFPNIKFKQTYGLSELGILPTKSEHSNSLWFLLGNDTVRYKISEGILLIKAPTAMLGYLNAPSPFDNEGWFITGDMVETKIVDGKEYLRILGRKSEIINVGGLKVYPAEVEDVLLQINNIRDVLVSGKKNPVTGQIVVALINIVNFEDENQLQRRIKRFCEDKIESYKIPILIKIVHYHLYGARYKKSRQASIDAFTCNNGDRTC